MEYGYNRDTELFLDQRGHEVTRLVKGIGLADVQVVMRLPNGKVHAAADPRKEGKAAAY
jgi:gamma-glutamyltranspeptidase